MLISLSSVVFVMICEPGQPVQTVEPEPDLYLIQPLNRHKNERKQKKNCKLSKLYKIEKENLNHVKEHNRFVNFVSISLLFYLVFYIFLYFSRIKYTKVKDGPT